MIRLSSTTKRCVFLTTGIISTTLLAVTTVIHVLTFWPINIANSVPFVYGLSVVIFPLCLPFLIVNYSEKRAKDDELITLSDSREQPAVEDTSDDKGVGSVLGPKWMVVYLLLGLYVGFNFFVYVIGDGNKQVERVGDGYVMKDRSTYVRHITVEEYDYYSARKLHGLTGHCLLFYFYFAAVSFQNSKKYNRVVEHA